MLIDLGAGKNRMGGSALAQTCKQVGDVPPDLDSTEDFKNFFNIFQQLNNGGKLLAWHDRSDGGLLACLAEMAFAGHCGLDINLNSLSDDSTAVLFNEELGGVIQVRSDDVELIKLGFESCKLNHMLHDIGTIADNFGLTITHNNSTVLSASINDLQKAWSETSFHMQSLRDNPECAQQEHNGITESNPGLNTHLTFDINEDIAAPYINKGTRPKIAILREQGVNGHIEMAAAFHKAGFESIDMHMSDIIDRGVQLDDFKGLVACGGFSYGDVLGAGEGWAKTVLFNNKARDVFQTYFNRDDTFSLGICNGCQMMANLKDLIPGAENWPHFVRNNSEQFEARFSLVEVTESPSILLAGMEGSRMPIAVAHGEGRAEYHDESHIKNAISTLRYVNNNGDATEAYPANPNGSPLGNTGFTSTDGRVTIMMPHPERVYRVVQNSWHPEEWREDAPWMRLFRNARVWVS